MYISMLKYMNSVYIIYSYKSSLYKYKDSIMICISILSVI